MAHDLAPLKVEDPVSLAVTAGTRFTNRGVIVSVTREGDSGFESAAVGVLHSVRTTRTGGFGDNVTVFNFGHGADFWVYKGDTVEIQQFGNA